MQKLRQKESDEISLKIRLEEKKLLEAQRKLESIRLLDALFERMKVCGDAAHRSMLFRIALAGHWLNFLRFSR